MKIVMSIGRGYKNEPVKHKCYYDGKNYRVIMCEYSDKPIDLWLGWPFGYSYKYEEELFKRLNRAFHESNQEDLAKYWKEAKLLKLHLKNKHA